MTETPEDFTTSFEASDQNDETEHSTIGQIEKLVTTANTVTTIAPLAPLPLVKHSTSVTIIDENSKDEEKDTISITDTGMVGSRNHLKSSEKTLLDSIVGDESDESDESDDESTLKSYIERATVDSLTTTTIDSVTEADSEDRTIESDSVDSSTSGIIVKPNVRSGIVSRDDIESIRGRALNFTASDRKPTKSSIIYVTAPPAVVKMSKSEDDLSDVSMDNDGMDVHSTEHRAMVPTSIEAVSKCESKVKKKCQIFK